MNNRVIKFRVFAHQKDDDGCVGYLETRSPAATGIDFFFDGGWRGIGYFINRPEAFTVEQFTGSFDKSGKEIYEGDICFADARRELIIFKDGMFGYDTTLGMHFIMIPRLMEVIGNVLEQEWMVTTYNLKR